MKCRRSFIKINFKVFVQETTSLYKTSRLDQRMSRDLTLNQKIPHKKLILRI